MLLSQIFSKTRREAPKGEDAVNAKLLIRAGLIQKMALYDVMVKSGKIGYEEVLLDMALQ